MKTCFKGHDIGINSLLAHLYVTKNIKGEIKMYPFSYNYLQTIFHILCNVCVLIKINIIYLFVSKKKIVMLHSRNMKSISEALSNSDL